MATFFSVIRYVPRVAADEAVNVGVLLASPDRVEVRSLEEWSRVKDFAGASWRDVKRLMHDMRSDPSAFLGLEGASSAPELRDVLSRWTRGIQFSDVSASLESLEVLARTVVPLVLQETDEVRARGRRMAVVKTVYTAAQTAFQRRFDRRSYGIVRLQAQVPGQKTQHKVDVGIVNGQIYAGAFVISFVSGQVDKQWKDTDAVAFAIEDIVHPRNEPTPLTVVLDEPQGQSGPLERAQRLFRNMGVPTIGFPEITQWADQAVAAVPEDILGS